MELPLPHTLKLTERQSLTVSGVTEVLNFDETAVRLQTTLGLLWVYGQQLRLKHLDPEGGVLTLTGTVGALVYEQKKGGRLSRLLG